jgi:hypothetical protein
MSELAQQQRVIEHEDLVRAVQALPPDSLVLRAVNAIVAELVEEVVQDLEDPEVVGETAHKLAGRLGGVRSVAHRLERWRQVEKGEA